jgi:hypothetical protein
MLPILKSTGNDNVFLSGSSHISAENFEYYETKYNFFTIYCLKNTQLLESSTFSLLLRFSDKFKQISLTGRSSKLVKHTDTLYHSNNSAGLSCLITMPSLELLGFRVADVICFILSNSSSEVLDKLK